jgi:hypothetical protein
MEKKQTAVEWYSNASHELIVKKTKGEINHVELLTMHHDLIQQAKEMEETEYKERLVKEFNPRLFNKPSKELPTDEEIYELAEKMLAVDYLSFTEGAKWMRDKIKGGNNE